MKSSSLGWFGVLAFVVGLPLTSVGAGTTLVGVAITLAGLVALLMLPRRDVGQELKAKRQEALAKLSGELRESGFDATKKLLGSDLSTALAVDDEGGRVFFTALQASPSYSIYSFKEVLAVELFEDGDLVTHTERSSQLVGAVVGGLLLGGAGAVVGGLSGKTNTTKNVKRVEIRLQLNDLNHPTFSIVLLGEEMTRADPRYAEARRMGEQWAALLGAVVHRGEVVAVHVTPAPAASLSTGSIADELLKLAGLRDAGVLTEEEFQMQKARALS